MVTFNSFATEPLAVATAMATCPPWIKPVFSMLIDVGWSLFRMPLILITLLENNGSCSLRSVQLPLLMIFTLCAWRACPDPSLPEIVPLLAKISECVGSERTKAELFELIDWLLVNVIVCWSFAEIETPASPSSATMLMLLVISYTDWLVSVFKK